MFNKLFQRSQRQADDIRQSAARITHDANEIGNLLLNYYHTHQLLHLSRVEGSNRPRPSVECQIAAIDLEQGQFVVVSMQALNLLEVLDVWGEFKLSHQGIRHRFKAQQIQSKQDINGEGLSFRFPEGIERTQLRNAFRVAISQAHPIDVLLCQSSDKELTGHLWDLSATGIRVAVREKIGLQSGQNYPQCRFTLPNGYTINCAGKLRHWHYNQRAKITFIGIQMADLEHADQRELSRFITELQRKQMMYAPQ